MSMIKYYRLSNKITQPEMAKLLGCSLPAYRNYENGKRQMPLNILAKFLKLRGTDSDLRLVKVLEELW